MAPKTKKKAEKKEYRLISVDEVKQRENLFQRHLQDLRDVFNQMDDVNAKYAKYLDEKEQKDEWDFFILCDGLPKAYVIPDIRLYVEKIRHFEHKSVLASMDWLLAVNERSILTQNIFQKDCTRPKLKIEIAPNFGKEYSNYIGNLLKLVENMNAFLVNDQKISKFSEKSIIDISDEKQLLYAEVRDLFDRYSYRVLCSESANFENIDAITAEYKYDDINFQMHIWMLKNVPIHFHKLETLNFEANLKQINVSVSMPVHILKDNLVLRGIHYEFDHFSEFAKSYCRTISVPFENIPSLIPNLYDSLKSEWALYLRVQQEVKENMIASRRDYEEKLIAFEEAEAEDSKRRKNKQEGDKKNKTKISKPVEVPAVPDDFFPEVYDDFLKTEYQVFAEFINDAYNPSHLKLTDDEINLKQNFLLGGTYELYFINKPDHLDFNSLKFNMNWHTNKGSVKIEKDFCITDNKVRKTNPHTGISTRKSAYSRLSQYRDTSFQSPDELLRNSMNNKNLKYFEIKFILPEYMCEWEVPLVCQYEDHLECEVVEEEDATDTVAYFTFPTGSFVSNSRLTISRLNDDSPNILGSLRSPFAYQSRRSQSSKSDSLFENFNLNKILEVPEIRKLQRYVLPFMLSSYHFPEETDLVNQTKTKEASAKKMIRKKQEEDVVLTNHIFNHKNQYNPERLFPKYNTGNIGRQKYKNDLEVEDPETFFDLIAMFNVLKDYLSNSYNKILRVPALKIPKKKPGLQKTFENVEHTRKKSISKKSHRNKSSDLKLRKSEISLTSTILSEISEKIEPETKTKEYSHWTTKNIHKSSFDREKRTMTIYTNRLGIFGFAINRYIHFPFQSWILEASEQNPEKEIILTIETQYVKVELKITAEGYRGSVTQLSKVFLRNPKIYLTFEQPISDMRILKNIFREKNVNIFVDNDARFYINKGYFCEKHMASEFHTYGCMAVHSSIMRFGYSTWNRLASRREIILNFAHNKEPQENDILVRVTPEKATFDEVRELCSENVDIIKLDYKPTWRNIENCSDLHHAIMSVYAGVASEGRVRDYNLISNIKNLLGHLRLFSFS